MRTIFIFFLFISHDSNCQGIKFPLDQKSFILGTLYDYRGRYFVASNANEVDYYDLYDKPLVACIDSMLKSTNIQHKKIIKGNKIHIVSDSVAKYVNSFYDFKNYGDSEFIKNALEPIFRGSLKDDILKDSLQIYSFLIGAYLRYGENLDSIYKIQVANSLSKASVYLNLLKKIGCSKISFKHLDGIPGQHIVYFYPNQKFQNYLTNFESLRKKLSSSHNLFYKNLLGKYYNTMITK